MKSIQVSRLIQMIPRSIFCQQRFNLMISGYYRGSVPPHASGSGMNKKVGATWSKRFTFDRSKYSLLRWPFLAMEFGWRHLVVHVTYAWLFKKRKRDLCVLSVAIISLPLFVLALTATLHRRADMLNLFSFLGTTRTERESSTR
jgi:hypothetical protein